MYSVTCHQIRNGATSYWNHILTFSSYKCLVSKVTLSFIRNLHNTPQHTTTTNPTFNIIAINVFCYVSSDTDWCHILLKPHFNLFFIEMSSIKSDIEFHKKFTQHAATELSAMICGSQVIPDDTAPNMHWQSVLKLVFRCSVCGLADTLFTETIFSYEYLQNTWRKIWGWGGCGSRVFCQKWK